MGVGGFKSHSLLFTPEKIERNKNKGGGVRESDRGFSDSPLGKYGRQ